MLKSDPGQLEEMKRILDDLNVYSNLAAKALEQGNPSAAFSSEKVPVAARLKSYWISIMTFTRKMIGGSQCPFFSLSQTIL